MNKYFVIGALLSVAIGAPFAEAQTNLVTIDGDVTPVGDWDDEYCIEDVDGCDDEPGQRDSKYACVASNYNTVQPADTLFRTSSPCPVLTRSSV